MRFFKEIGRRLAVARRHAAVPLAAGLASLALTGRAAAQDFSGFAESPGGGVFSIFDEVRGGASFSVQDNDDSGVIVRGELLFRAFGQPYQNYFANTLLRPRLHVGGALATEDGGVSQVYGGLTWNFPLFGAVFLEASFGGTWHDGPLASPGDGLDLGCHWLFRESVGLGYDVNEHWRVLVAADHSSHAKLCDGGDAGNSGITHVGGYIGYRF